VSSLTTIDLNAIPWGNPDSVPSVYCNNASIGIAPWDIRILFAEIITTGSAGDSAVLLRANIAMNPAHAKALAGALASAVTAYEDQFGQINMPNAESKLPSKVEKEL
jgi:hypothetical protein